MPMEPDSRFSEILNDIRAQQKRARAARHLDAHTELANNVYPVLTAIVEAVDERISETEELLAGLVDGGESIIQADLAAQIKATLELATQLCDAVEKGDDTRVVVQALREAVKLTSTAVDEVTIEAAGEGEGEGESPEAASDETPDETPAAEPAEPAAPATPGEG